MSQTRNAAIIVAAGKGIRAGGGLPKQWRDVAGRSSVAWVLQRFRHHPGIHRIVLVLSAEDMALAAGYRDITVVAGGADRQASVRAGLEALADQGISHVLIHDAARPCLSAALIDRVLAALGASPGAAPALAVTDALWTGAEGLVSGTRDRDGLFRAQTPQGFLFDAILAAHRAHPGGAADDVAVARDAGLDVAIVEGEDSNLKITTPADFSRAAAILRGQMDIRCGQGYDVHAFCDGDAVVLCGVEIAHDKALLGHSDADVAMHAITDAIYGALAEGDIGRHFPPSDAKWKGAASHLFLTHAGELARARGYEISNIDCTIICEYPKIGPHAEAMRAELANILEMEMDRISVKATTSEKLGFTGRQEGIAATAIATLVRP